VDIQAENHGAPVSLLREPVERRRKGRLGSKMRLRTRVVDEDQPPRGSRAIALPRGDGSAPPPSPVSAGPSRADRCDCRSPRRGRDPRSRDPPRGFRSSSCAARRQRESPPGAPGSRPPAASRGGRCGRSPQRHLPAIPGPAPRAPPWRRGRAGSAAESRSPRPRRVAAANASVLAAAPGPAASSPPRMNQAAACCDSAATASEP
jgi:hypothetical protein